jgi:hypothetical protein
VNPSRHASWAWIVGLVLLAAWPASSALGGPSKRYTGQPFTAPEAADPVIEGTLQGASRHLSGRHWSVPAPSADASAPSPSAASSVSASEAARYAGAIVLGLLAASLVVLGLRAWVRLRRRRLANSLVRYAIAYRRGDVAAY